jgi:hypothetical protein
MNKASDFSFTIFSSGNAEVKSESARLATAIEEQLPSYSETLPGPLLVSGVVENFGVSEVIIGCTLFVTAVETLAKDLRKNLWDDFYKVIIQPRYVAFLEKLDRRLKGGNARARKTFVDGVWYAQFSVLVSISVVGNTFEEVAQQFHLVQGVHENALRWIIANGSGGKPVHHFKIEGGKVNVDPILLDRFVDTLR